MKNYQEPMVKIMKFSVEDIISTSGGENEFEEMPFGMDSIFVA